MVNRPNISQAPLRKYAYDASSPPKVEYMGENNSAFAAEGDATWYVTKYTYDVNGNVTTIQVLQGSWTGRALLSWV
jgi:YD repeat-containing protein